MLNLPDSKRSSISFTEIFAWLLVAAAGGMFVIPFSCSNFAMDWIDYATFVGGTAGPLAALAGFLFVYVAFIESKEQKAEQDKQFNVQSFDQILSRLVENYQNISLNHFIDERLYGMIESMKNNLEKLSSSEEDAKKSKDIFKGAFHGNFRRLKKWIKSITSILAHIDNYRHLDIVDSRERMVLNLMTKEEKRALFYFYFLDDPEFSENEKQSLKTFLKRVDPVDLISPDHYIWLSN